MSSAPGQRVKDSLAQAHGTGSSIVSDNPLAMVLWERLLSPPITSVLWYLIFTRKLSRRELLALGQA